MAGCVHDLLAQQAASNPDSPALWWQGCKVSYGGLHQRSKQLGARLTAIGHRGQRVGILAWNCPEFLELIYGGSAAARAAK